MARNAEAAGHSLKTKKPQCGNTEASEINAVIDQENNVMSDNSTNVIPFNFREQQVRTLVIAGEHGSWLQMYAGFLRSATPLRRCRPWTKMNGLCST